MSDYVAELAKLEAAGQLRSLKVIDPQSINFSTNDYLGIGDCSALQEEFYSLQNPARSHAYKCGATSSRLLSGNFEGYAQLEQLLADSYQRSALVFNSGYHANIGILPALTTKQDLILSDKLNHASIVDGCQLSAARTMRFRHGDLEHLEKLLTKHRDDYDNVFIITESIFSMDGDLADLSKLVQLRNQYDCFLLVDEAHAIGVRGESGLGLCEEFGLLSVVDLIIGTFGKALASSGAFVICSETIKKWLINKMRSLIFTTALPPVVVHWNYFVFKKMLGMTDRRAKLFSLAKFCRTQLEGFYPIIGDSQIIPIMVGDNHQTVALAEKAKLAGFVVFPIRPPTVPVGTSRLRLSLSASMTESDLLPLLNLLKGEV